MYDLKSFLEKKTKMAIKMFHNIYKIFFKESLNPFINIFVFSCNIKVLGL